MSVVTIPQEFQRGKTPALRSNGIVVQASSLLEKLAENLHQRK